MVDTPPAIPETPRAPDAAPALDDPVPQAAPRVAPEAAPPPPVEAERAPEVTELAAPEPEPEAEPVPEEEAPTAPQEAATEIVTEAEEPAGRAPDETVRPRGRPQRTAAAPPTPVEQSPGESFEAASTTEPDPVPEPEPEPAVPDEPPADEPSSDTTADAIAAAVAAANEVESAPQVGAAAGPPLTAGERDALRLAVQQCWNVGSLSSEALQTSVVVSVRMVRDGKPDTASIRMKDWQGGSESAAKQAFEAARRAIIVCGRQGYDLPSEKYDQWAEVEMTFNPESMRIR